MRTSLTTSKKCFLTILYNNKMNLYKDTQTKEVYHLDDIESKGEFKYKMLKDPKSIIGKIYYSKIVLMNEQRFRELEKINNI